MILIKKKKKVNSSAGLSIRNGIISLIVFTSDYPTPGSSIRKPCSSVLTICLSQTLQNLNNNKAAKVEG